MAELVTWCTSRIAILKWLQILCALVAVLFLVDGRFQWSAYSAIFVTCVVLACLSFITLAIYFFRLHLQNKQLPWVTLEIAFNATATVACVVASCVLIYDIAKMSGGKYGHHRYSAPANIGNQGWLHRVIFVLVALLLDTVFYVCSLLRTKQAGIQ